MTTFLLPNISPDVQVKLPQSVSKGEFLDFPAFKSWLATIQESFAGQEEASHEFHSAEERYWLRSIEVQSVKRFGERIGFLAMDTVVSNGAGTKHLPGFVFLRGGSVAILIVLSPVGNPDERYVVMTQQPRIPAGSLRFWEIPAGMIDDQGNFAGAAAKELYEETKLTVPEHELFDMTAAALKDAKDVEPHLERAMYPSPGGSDEFIALFLWEREMTENQIHDMRNRLTGVDREQITVKIVKYEDLWREGARDAKTLGARALYEGLKYEGIV